MIYEKSKSTELRRGSLLRFCSKMPRVRFKLLKYTDLAAILKIQKGSRLPHVDFIGLVPLFMVKIKPHLKPKNEVAKTGRLSSIICGFTRAASGENFALDAN